MKTVLVVASLFCAVSLQSANAAQPHFKTASIETIAQRGHESGSSMSSYMKRRLLSGSKKRNISRRHKKGMQVFVKVTGSRGSVVELLVTCKRKKVLLTYNKIDKKFCSLKYKCYKSLPLAINPHCK